jgi:hypothetical protein
MTLQKSAITAMALLFGAGLFATGALAQAAPKKERSAISKECSAKADAQNLHGKERKVFRTKCKRDAAAAAKKG